MKSHCPPRVSILMPVHNEERYLKTALKSIIRQSLTDWELVVVDDGSDDATPDILSHAARCDSRVRVIRREERGGLVAALNAGLATCNAPLLARMDGDDICHPRRIEVQANYLDNHPEVGLVACAFRHFPRASIKQGMLAYEKWQNELSDHDLIIRDLYVESPFVHPSIMTRKILLEDLSGYRSNGWPEDYDLWLRMAASGYRFARIPQKLFFWRDHPGRATRTNDAYSVSSFRSCKAHHLSHGFLKNVEQITIAGAGQEGRAWQRQLHAMGIKVTCWLDVDPRRIGRILHNAPVISTAEFNVMNGKILVAIGVRGAREEFRTLMQKMGLQEDTDYVCVA